MKRILNVVRLHLVGRYTALALPWIILAIAFSITLLVWFLVRSVGGQIAVVYSGAGASIMIYLMVFASLAITKTFPFALGYGVTRRDFYLGTALTLFLLSAGYSVILVVLSYIEQATHGWGLGGILFSPIGYGQGGPFERWIVYTASILFFSAIGMSVATVYMRWRLNGMLVFWTLASLLAIGGLALIGLTSSWAAVDAWFTANGAVGIALWTLVPTVLAAAAGYFVLQRATPKN